MEKKFNYVYVTTNIVNGKQYIGDHSTDNIKKDNYLGSGRPIFIKALKKYGRTNFKKEILEFFPTKQEAFNAQEKYIKQFNTLNPNGYNISPIGGLGNSGCFSEEMKLKHSILLSGENNGMFGKNHSDESKQKMKLNMKGRIPWNKGKHGIYSEEYLEKLRKLDRKGEKNPMFGKRKRKLR
jgi:group I intron endonuclease